MSNEPAGVRSVDRAVGVLEILARRGEAGVTELAGELGVHKSTAFRLVAALENRGLVEQVAERGKYRLGLGIVHLAGGVTARLDLTRESRPVAERLAAQVGETVNVAVLQGRTAVNVDQVRGPSAVTAHNWIGQPTALHATSSGKVLLAHLPAARRDDLLAEPLERFTARTVVDRDTLENELVAVLKTGYATTFGELEEGLDAVAAPIRSFDGSVIAALSASGPSYRLTGARMAAAAAAVRAAAAEIGRRLGHLDRTAPTPAPAPTPAR